MQEAFRKAAAQNPDSPLSSTITDVTQKQDYEAYKQREDARAERLKGDFRDLGKRWHETLDVSVRSFLSLDTRTLKGKPIEGESASKAQSLLGSLNEKSPDERLELLEEMANGMGIHEDQPAPDALKLKLIRRLTENPLFDIRDRFLGVSYSPYSQEFLEAYSTMSGYNEKQNAVFREFMKNNSGLKGNVKLPDLYTGISNWIDAQNTQSSSSQ